MTSILLLPLDLDSLAILSADPARYAEREGIGLGEAAPIVRTLAQQTTAFLESRADGGDEWGPYLAADADTREVVGTCAYKAAPDGEGMVEIAYYTFPPHEGRGYATAMAAALRERAVASPAVRTVRAHTLPERNASARILSKLGFEGPRDVIDPEDGPVWRWDWRPA